MSARSLALYRALVRASVRMENYNFRDYAQRRARIGFEENRSVGGEALESEVKKGMEQLDMLRRQVMIGSLYPPTTRSVMEGMLDNSSR